MMNTGQCEGRKWGREVLKGVGVGEEREGCGLEAEGCIHGWMGG